MWNGFASGDLVPEISDLIASPPSHLFSSLQGVELLHRNLAAIPEILTFQEFGGTDLRRSQRPEMIWNPSIPPRTRGGGDETEDGDAAFLFLLLQEQIQRTSTAGEPSVTRDPSADAGEDFPDPFQGSREAMEDLVLVFQRDPLLPDTWIRESPVEPVLSPDPSAGRPAGEKPSNPAFYDSRERRRKSKRPSQYDGIDPKYFNESVPCVCVCVRDSFSHVLN